MTGGTHYLKKAENMSRFAGETYTQIVLSSSINKSQTGGGKKSNI